MKYKGRNKTFQIAIAKFVDFIYCTGLMDCFIIKKGIYISLEAPNRRHMHDFVILFLRNTHFFFHELSLFVCLYRATIILIRVARIFHSLHSLNCHVFKVVHVHVFFFGISLRFYFLFHLLYLYVVCACMPFR